MNYAVIVAGGSGSRMQSDTPKQFMALQGLPILMHTVLAFGQSGIDMEIIVVLATELIPQWNKLCQLHRFEKRHVVIAGGETRFHSVKNALEYLRNTVLPEKQDVLVAIHDAARPLVTNTLITRSFQEAAMFGSSVAAVRSTDSVRISDNPNDSEAIDRQKVYLVQTPQTFLLGHLFKAYEQEFEAAFTDDASVIQKSGYPIHLTEGDIRNIKITFAQDIGLAGFLLAQQR